MGKFSFGVFKDYRRSNQTVSFVPPRFEGVSK